MASIRVKPSGGVRFIPQTATATAATQGGGLANGLAGFGKTVSSVGNVLQERQDKRDITSARAAYADMSLQFDQEQETREKSAKLGDIGFYDISKKAFDDTTAKFMEGLNGKQQNALAAQMSGNRVHKMRGAMSFQAQHNVKSDIHDIGKIQAGIANNLYRGDITYDQASAQLQVSLQDTTIGEGGQADIHTSALPAFRTSYANGLLSNPVQGLAAMKAGEADFLPPEEKQKLQDDLTAGIVGLQTKQQNQKLADTAAAFPKLFEALEDENTTPRDIEAYHALGVPRSVIDKLKQNLIRLQTPVRTTEEKIKVEGEIFARYTALTIAKKSGKWKTEQGLDEVLKFQTYLSEQIAQGYVPLSRVGAMMGNAEKAAQNIIAGSGSNGFSRLIGMSEPYDDGISNINDNAETNSISTDVKVRHAREFTTLMQNAKPLDGETKNQMAVRLSEEAIANVAKEDIPSMRHLKDVPNAVITKNGAVKRTAPGQRDLKATRKIGNREMAYDSKNNTWGWITTAADGTRTGVEMTNDEARKYLGDSFKDTELPGPNLDIEGEAGTKLTDTDTVDEKVTAIVEPKAPKEPKLEGPNLEVQDDTSNQTRLADTNFKEDIFGANINASPSEDAIDMVTSGLVESEGTGDMVTGIPTGEGGITEIRHREIEARVGRPLSDKQARIQAVRDDSVTLHDGLEGFDKLGSRVQAAILDMAYNVGANKVLSFKNLRKGVAEGDVDVILRNTLDTAIVGGKTMIGIANRRAKMYNQANTNANNAITTVQQLSDGTIMYMNGDRVIFSFKRPKHEDSRAEIANIMPRSA